MARDTCRHGDHPHPSTPRRSKSGVDELDFKRSSFAARLDMKMDLETPLSPIEEEEPSENSIAPLQVKLTLRFLDPVVRSVFNRTYSSSQSFMPTDRLCRGLLRRIEHCSEELITRKDSGALDPTQCLLKGPKDLRFEISFQIYRRDYSGAWAERAIRSYQKQPLTSASAMDILRSTHNIIGIFLKRHDEHFRWIDEPSQEYFPEKPATFKPSLTGPLDLACVPRSRFIESTQRWEAVPGYTLEITLESRDASRRQPDIRRILKVDSTQTAPLNLSLAEDLSWQAYRAVEDVLDSRKHAFDMEHAGCEAVDGVPDCGCQHFVEDALKVELRSTNNLGPTYDHLCRNIQSRLRLFKHPTGQDCDEFVNLVRACFQKLRNRTDEKLNMLNDFDFRIAELIGHGWHVKNPARFIIDGKESYTRRSIEALLDRIRTGVGDVLRGHDVAIRMIAYKRGHLILDKALISRNHQESPDPIPFRAPEDEQKLFVAQLKARIQEDIDMICKDTCSLEDIPEVASESEHLPRLRTTRSHHFKPRPMASQGSLYTLPGSPGIFTEPPVPPCVPTRKSSRVFPLVPGRYSEEERPSSITTSARESAIGMDSDSNYRASCGSHSLKESASAKFTQNHHENAHRGEESFGLRPAAELTRARDVADDSSSSILTYSSLPALTESETPSPGQSMLTTPNVRTASPQSDTSPFFKDSDSGPLIMATPDSNFGHLPVAESLTRPKSPGVSFVRPRTPLDGGAQDSASPNTPRASRDSNSADNSAVTRASRKIRQAYDNGMGTQVAVKGDVTIGSVLHDNTASDSKPAEVEVVEAVSSQVTDDLPTEGWLMHCEEDDEVVVEEDHPVLASPEESNSIVGIDNCAPSDALKPELEEAFTEQEPTDSVSEQQVHVETDQVEAVTSLASEQDDQQALGDEKNTQPSIPTETSESTCQVGPDETVVDNESACSNDAMNLPTEDEMSQSKAGCSKEDEATDAADNSQHQSAPGEPKSTETDLRLTDMSEVSETGQLVPSSDSEVDVGQGSQATRPSSPEVEEHIVIGQVEESATEECSNAPETVLPGPETCATEPEATSEVFNAVEVQDGAQVELETTSGASKESTTAPDGFSDPSTNDSVSIEDQVTTSVRVFPPESVPSPEVASNPSPSLPRSSKYLHPSPVSYKLGTGMRQSRSSFSSCSEWEDYVSEPRQSTDSVDTFRLAPSSEGDDEPRRPDSPIRLGKPTAGFLGLRESRWAGFGIRGALTGTHAFDRAPAASSPRSPRHKAHTEQLGPKHDVPVAGVGAAHLRPATSHRKMIHLSHKKSNSCVIFPGPQAKSPKLNTKESKELKARERTAPKSEDNIKPAVAESNPDDGGGRFPRAMMLVAGLAIVSSVVNRNSA
ncbi:hypothetical protein VMCG_01215 [Cytospora schulzeri]|uniref:Pt repeat family protein n=1 Tax=Cytospora schulzeri TaxID=448051 RepID=A0A423X4U2_9PEZI|nr:hypothetical protein VMCG_01215 [Valsa malicola]